MRIHRLSVVAALGALAAAAPAAHAAAPGWSTPHTASTVTTGTYASAPNGQGVQLFANGGVPQRTAQLRAIKADATQGTAVGVNAGGAGFDLFDLDMNNSARLVATWTRDLENAQPVPVAVALGSRTSLPRTATVFTTGGLVSDHASAIDDNGTAVVAWVQSPIGATIAAPTTVMAATLRSGQAPILTTVATRTGALINNLAVGFDSNARAIVTWNVTPNENGGPGILGVARGTGPGTFAPAVETTVEPTQQLLDLVTFVTGDGGLLLFWTNGSTATGPIAIRFSQANGAGAFTAPRTLISGNAGGGLPAYAANSAGRAAVVFPLASGSANGTSLRVLLRTSSGTWGSARLLGPSGTRTIRRISLGVDARGRVVALWDDAGGSSSTPTRILAARSSSSTNPLNTYNQVSQRSGDRRCQTPSLALSSSGDGFGSWLCSTSSSGAINGPRLARLTAPS